MPDHIASIRNLGPAMQSAFARAGIADAETLRSLGPDAAYGRLLAHGERPHFMAYTALVLGLQGRPYTDIGADEKRALRARFDAIKDAAEDAGMQDKGRARMDAALAEIGVIEKRSQPTSSRPAKK